LRPRAILSESREIASSGAENPHDQAIIRFSSGLYRFLILSIRRQSSDALVVDVITASPEKTGDDQ
jgi:hypothetical protein